MLKHLEITSSRKTIVIRGGGTGGACGACALPIFLEGKHKVFPRFSPFAWFFRNVHPLILTPSALPIAGKDYLFANITLPPQNLSPIPFAVPIALFPRMFTKTSGQSASKREAVASAAPSP